ncbi:tetratricopeptide repeat protein [bacterium]|nr:tetratricopeptide repeat protein [bacterium]
MNEKIYRKLHNALTANDYESVRKIAENELKRIGAMDEYYFYLALVSDDMKEKRDLYTKAIAQNPDFMDAYLNRGLVHNELKDYENSIKDYDKAIELDPKCALAYNNRGYTKYKMQDYKGALKDYNKAILLNPKLSIALDNKAKLVSEVCLEDDSTFSEKYYLSLGIGDVNKGNFTEAVENFNEALKYNPLSSLVHFYRGVAFQSMNKIDEAIDAYTKSIEINKKMIDAYFNRGQLLFKDNPKQAMDDFVTAVALDPKFIDAYYSIAAIQKNMGQYKEAVQNLDKILEIEPNAVNAKALKKLIMNKYM